MQCIIVFILLHHFLFITASQFIFYEIIVFILLNHSLFVTASLFINGNDALIGSCINITAAMLVRGTLTDLRIPASTVEERYNTAVEPKTPN